MTFVFRALWPITDETRPFLDLCNEANHDLPALFVQAHARQTAAGRYSVAPSSQVPGSGRVTEWVLLYECPAARLPARRHQMHRQAVA